MWKSIGCGILLMTLVACGADHSRTFKITVDACDDAWVELDIDALVEKAENQEESTNAPEIEGEVSAQLVPK